MSSVSVKFAQSSRQWEARDDTYELSQTLLTNKKQGNLDYVHAAYIIKPTQTRIYREKYTFCIMKSLEHLKNLKTGRVPYLGLELTHACHQKPNPSREIVPLICIFKYLLVGYSVLDRGHSLAM
jgi:hypothetical protein